MSGSAFWRKCVALLTLSVFTVAISGCGPQATTGTKPQAGKQPANAAQAGSTTGAGAESKGPGAEVPEAAPAKDATAPVGDDEKASEDKPANE